MGSGATCLDRASVLHLPPIPVLRSPALVVYGRLLVLGATHQKLHEEVIAAGGWIEEGHFRRMLPEAQIFKNLFYPLNNVDEAELDGLVLFDRYAFLIEGKAGVFGRARRGGKSAIQDQLRDLISDPAEQALRARSYIEKSAVPTFRSHECSASAPHWGTSDFATYA